MKIIERQKVHYIFSDSDTFEDSITVVEVIYNIDGGYNENEFNDESRSNFWRYQQ